MFILALTNLRMFATGAISKNKQSILRNKPDREKVNECSLVGQSVRHERAQAIIT